jgi:homoserine kinase type II
VDVFVVQHVHVLDENEEDIKFIGVYSSKESAEGAVQRLRLQPGFSDTPGGFTIDLYEVDQDNWSEGFVTKRISQAEQEKGSCSP